MFKILNGLLLGGTVVLSLSFLVGVSLQNRQPPIEPMRSYTGQVSIVGHSEDGTLHTVRKDAVARLRKVEGDRGLEFLGCQWQARDSQLVLKSPCQAQDLGEGLSLENGHFDYSQEFGRLRIEIKGTVASREMIVLFYGWLQGVEL